MLGSPPQLYASVAFTHGAIGSGTLVNYTAECSSIAATGTASPITVAGMSIGAATTCRFKTTFTAFTGQRPVLIAFKAKATLALALPAAVCDA